MAKINKGFLISIILILVFSLMVQAQNLLDQGINEYNSGNYEEAINNLTSYAVENKDSYLANFYLGLSYSKLDQYGLAIDSFNYARKVKGDSYNLLVNLGRAYYNNNQKDKAYDVLIKAEGFTPLDEQVYNLLGLIHMDKREYNQAIENFEDALDKDQSNFYVYNNLSLSYIQLGNFKEARKYIDQAVELEPSVPYVYNNAGIIYENLQNYEQAVKLYEKALELDPEYKKAEVNIQRVKNKAQ